MPCRKRCGDQWWHGKIKDCGYRITAGREAIIETFSATHDHLSVEDVYARIHDRFPNVGLTTIYRTLGVLVNAGLVFKFDFGDGKARYELAEGPKGAHHHHHLVCTKCSEVVEIAECFPEKIEKRIAAQNGFKAVTHKLEFFGICPDCQR